jgi:type IV pilus assembly protein PilP
LKRKKRKKRRNHNLFKDNVIEMTGGTHTKWLALMSGMILIMLSCNLQTEPAPKPEVVKKKIVVPKKPEPLKETVTPDPQKTKSATIQKLPVTEPKPLTLAEKKTEPAVSQKTTDNVQPKEKPEMVISETAQKKLSAQDIPLYNPVGRIDPFSPLIRSQSESRPAKKKLKKRIPRTPLEKMDFSQMKLVAIVKSPKGDRALVEEAGGKGYIISKGTYMGLNAGKVTEIFKDRIVIEEAVENVLGEVVSQKRELKLQKPPGEF